MKVIALFFSFLFAAVAVQAEVAPRAFNVNRALEMRGGGAIGPLDGDLAVKLSKAAATSYIAGSASKYITSKTGGDDTQLADFVTGDLFQLNALITVVAAAMCGLADSGFGTLETLAVGGALALALKLIDSGFTVDTVKDNSVQTVLAVAMLFIAYA